MTKLTRNDGLELRRLDAKIPDYLVMGFLQTLKEKGAAQIQPKNSVLLQHQGTASDILTTSQELIADRSSLSKFFMAQSMLKLPSDCGQRLIPKLVDDIACSDPQRPFISVPRSSNLEDGFEDINYSRFARAVNRCSWWIEKHLGIVQESQTLAYFGPLDVRYLIVLLAASKTGHVVCAHASSRRTSLQTNNAQIFLSSHRNSLEAHLTLLEQTRCCKVLVAKQCPAVTEKILEQRPMSEFSMPDFEYFDNDEYVEIYPWQGTFEEVKDKALVILHTSGSTGIPKPVYVNHGTFAGNDAHQLIPSLGGRPTFCDYVRGKRYFLALPMFHSANLTFTLGFNVFFGVTCVIPPSVPITANIIDKVHTFGNVHGSLLPPSSVVDIFNDSEHLSNMTQRLQFVSYVGGTLPKEIGDAISSKIRVITLFGSTETKLFPIEINEDPADWEYIPISRFLGHEFRPSRDSLSELVIVRKEELYLFQGVFSTFPDLQEYSMKDLYEQHSKKLGLWAFRARADDIIALSNAEKLNPITMETIISGHPAVKSALIGGQGQFQAALLIEPDRPIVGQDNSSKFLLEIWPTVLQANRDCPAHGRIVKDFIMVTSPEKPLPRAGKDTVQRFAALELYADEFNALYRSKDKNSQPEPMDTVAKASSTTKVEASKQATGSREQVGEPPQGLAEMPVVDLDARIEAVLHRILPNVLSQQLGPAMVQMMMKLLLPPTAQISATKGYCDHVVNSTTTGETLPSRSQGLRQGILHAIKESTYLYNLNDQANLFECGLDSLQVTALVGEINAFLEEFGSNLSRISDKTIYDNPSIERLLAAIGKSSHKMES